MTDLPMPEAAFTSKPRVHRDDLAAVITGLPDNWYRTIDLYPRYLAQCERSGREPADTKTLGMALGRLRCPKRSAHGHVSIWHIIPMFARSVSAPRPVHDDPWV